MVASSSNKQPKANSKLASKTKKYPPKSVLVCPFALQWPNFAPEGVESVRLEFIESTKGMKRSNIKLYWKQLHQIPKDKRHQAKNRQNSHDKMENCGKTEAEERWGHLLFGFNCIMRNLLQNKVSALLVKKNCGQYLGLQFMPVCTSRNIPLVALEDLESLAGDEAGLGITHSCLAIGLKKSAVEAEAFKELHRKMAVAWREAVNPQEPEAVNPQEPEAVNPQEPEAVNPQEPEAVNPQEPEAVNQQEPEGELEKPRLEGQGRATKLESISIDKYLLKRSSTALRVFEPQEKSSSKPLDYFSFGSLDLEEKQASGCGGTQGLPRPSHERVRKKKKMERKEKVERKEEESAEESSGDDFEIDFCPPEEDKKLPSFPPKKSMKRTLSAQYIPAAVKKIKANINRRKNN